MNLLQLFKSLQRQRRGMAIVVDEFGGVAGLVTMEDILTELVGAVSTRGGAGGFCDGETRAGALAREWDDAAG